MRERIFAVALGAVVLAVMSTEASAWYCEARSPRAWGWGSHVSLPRAQRRALSECARRTPRYQTCYIAFCR